MSESMNIHDSHRMIYVLVDPGMLLVHSPLNIFSISPFDFMQRPAIIDLIKKTGFYGCVCEY